MQRRFLLGSAATAAAAKLILTREENNNAALESVKETILSKNGLTPSRAEQASALSATAPDRPLDLLVIGGGATGSGVALDAATRGLRVGLVERDDFSSGSSSRSTKLLHGEGFLGVAIWAPSDGIPERSQSFKLALV
ncbi:hypothetical protein QJS10_CPB21g00546 [Acorus calamus]|uniref:Glycerol-3-phosphate dehydrogenase n=1 Tax=Acorus calamus TaxID=4465 RepID=A0AAV9C5H8_ACOCL|nr:hypothetical protein QJS10_CPB21g00546 [Acorus calamus]